MKNKLFAALLLALLALAVTSCYSARSKQGCPMNTNSNAKFRG